MMRHFVCWSGVALLLCFWSQPVQSKPKSFLESFATSSNRKQVLSTLIPNTRDYYYWHTLHYQNTGKLKRARQMLQQWPARHSGPKLDQLRRRQALLEYNRSPNQTIAFLRSKLRPVLHHSGPSRRFGKTTIPSTFDATKLRPKMFADYQKSAPKTGIPRFFDERTLYENSDQRYAGRTLRELLHRLRRPDYPDLAKLVAQDLATLPLRQFGSITIDKQLLLSQLEALQKLRPSLLKNKTFLKTYIAKLRPDPSRHQPYHMTAYSNYIDALWRFVKGLSPAYNGLKKHVMFHMLQRDVQRGRYSQKRFTAFLSLPRSASYTNKAYLRRNSSVDSYQYKRWTQLGDDRKDQPLVRHYLEQLLRRGAKASNWQAYLQPGYLRRIEIEMKLLQGRNTKRWMRKLSPSEFTRLKQRTELQFAPNNKRYIGSKDIIRLTIELKNVPTLLIKVYRLNSQQIQRKKPSLLAPHQLDLVGLIAHSERRRRYRLPPLRRHKRIFRFGSLTKRGIYAIDFIGGGKAIRAIVQKGRLQATQMLTDAGHRLTIFDDMGQHIKDASVLMGAQRFKANANGHIFLPLTNNPGKKTVYLQHDGFSTSYTLEQSQETYRLHAGFYVDRESLLKHKRATVLIRPRLQLSGQATSIALLNQVKLQLEAKDMFGIKTIKTIEGFRLFDDKESHYSFRVPPHLSSLTFRLIGRVYNLSKRTTQTLRAQKQFSLNEIDHSFQIATWHLRKTRTGYILSLRDKAGNGLPGRRTRLTFTLRGISSSVGGFIRQTNAKGQIFIRSNRDITKLHAKTRFIHGKWVLNKDYTTLPESLHGTTASTFKIPYHGAHKTPQKSHWSLLERRKFHYISDAFGKMSIRDGYLLIENLSVGDYELYYRPTGQRTRIRIIKAAGGSSTKSTTRQASSLGWLRGARRALAITRSTPIQIQSLSATKGQLSFKVSQATKNTRVHVFATRFLPRYELTELFHSPPPSDIEPVQWTRKRSTYSGVKSLEREHLYILARKYAKKYPGNMLPRPGLLLQPWAHNPVGSESGVGLGGFGTRGSGGGGGGGRMRGRSGTKYMLRTGGAGFTIYPPNLDFLKHPSRMRINLRPNANGQISIPLALAKHHPHIHIFAIDKGQLIYKEWIGPDSPMKRRDIRLRASLSPKRHYASKTQVSLLQRGQTLAIQPRQFSRVVAIDSLAKAFALLQSLANTSAMQSFRFITRWHKLTNKQKLHYYNKFASHELHFFLYRKDPAFFQNIIAPHLRNKMAKTFMDRWLLRMNLQVYLRPWRFARLNIIERILLSRRLPQAGAAIRRHLREKEAVRTRNVPAEHKLLMTVLESDRLDVASLSSGSASTQKEPTSPRSGRYRKADAHNHLTLPLALIKQYQSALDSVAQRLTPSQKRRLQKIIRLHKARQQLARLYRPIERTKEYAETHYYKVRLDNQNGELIDMNPFWADAAAHRSGRFLSKHLAYTAGRTSEMLMALAFLDLPAESKGIARRSTTKRITLRPNGATIIYAQRLQRANLPKRKAALLVRQHCFRMGRRFYTHKRKRLRPRPTTFSRNSKLTCEIVVTNPTPITQHLDLLLQIPQGSIPLNRTKPTSSRSIELAPYRTYHQQYHFTFPQTGKYEHFPVHVSRRGKLLSFATPRPFHIVEQKRSFDKNDWSQLAERGKDQEILAALRKNNIYALDLSRLYWRLRRRPFFQALRKELKRRHVYDERVWAYSMYHKHKASLQTYLRFADTFTKSCGPHLRSPLLNIDPIVRRYYQHLEYKPLYNARAHLYNQKHSIYDAQFAHQYKQFMRLLSFKPRLSSEDRMALTYYLLLQDRTSEAIAQFSKVKAAALTTKLQYDYFRVYIAFTKGQTQLARKIANRYRTYPVKRWRGAFAEALQQLQELGGKGATSRPGKGRRDALSISREASFDFTVSRNTIRIEHQGVKRFKIRYYLMDVERLFSRKPFVRKQTGPFAMLRPHQIQRTKARQSGQTTIRIPWKMRSKNVIIEVLAADLRKTRHHYANALHTQVMSRIGQLRVLQRRTKRPLARVYIKVYTKSKYGSISFYKDGYTDLRGRFDYASLRAGSLRKVKRFSILITHPKYGSMLREVAPPNL